MRTSAAGALNLSTLLGALRRGGAVPDRSRPAGAARPETEDAALALRRSTAAGRPASEVRAALDRIEALGDVERREVLDPLGRRVRDGRETTLRLGTARAVQVDGTTCGSATLALLAAAGDPVLALGLVEGGVDAWARLQVVLRARTARVRPSAAWPAPSGLPGWPEALGTPPWGAARDARYADVRYRQHVVDDHDADGAVALRAAARSARAGVPVPLFTGGDLSRGVATAVPRHVVLLCDVVGEVGSETWRVYEPGSGRVHGVPQRDVLGSPEPSEALRRALGGWTRVAWAVLPVAWTP